MWERLNSAEPRVSAGWKIHVSTSFRHASEVRRRLYEYSKHSITAGKVLASGRSTFLKQNGVDAMREAAGKFATFYPDSEHLETVAEELVELLSDLDEGPRILGDFRHRESQVHLRYGAHLSSYTTDSEGRQISGLRHEDGTVSPDIRGISPYLPPGIVLPDFVRDDYVVPPEPFPYEVSSAFRHTVSGGVYECTQQGKRYVLKEARPMIGYDDLGRDAVQRLRAEYEYLKMLSSNDAVVDAAAPFAYGGHWFMPMELLVGETFEDWIATNLPRFWMSNSSFRRLGYLNEVNELIAEIESAVEKINRDGIIIGDVSPANIIITARGPRIVDFGSASRAGSKISAVRGLLCKVKDSNATRERDLEGLRALRRYALWPSSRQVLDSTCDILLSTKRDAPEVTDAVMATILGEVQGEKFPPRETDLGVLRSSLENAAESLEDESNGLHSLFSGTLGLALALGPNSDWALTRIRRAQKRGYALMKAEELGAGLDDGAMALAIAGKVLGDDEFAYDAACYSASRFEKHPFGLSLQYGLAGVLSGLRLLNSSGIDLQWENERLTEIGESLLAEACEAIRPGILSTTTPLIGEMAVRDRLEDTAGVESRLTSFLNLDLETTGGMPTCSIQGRIDPYLATGGAGVIATLLTVSGRGGVRNHYSVEDKNHPRIRYADNESILLGRAGVELVKRLSNVTDDVYGIELGSQLEMALRSWRERGQNDARTLSFGYGAAGALLTGEGKFWLVRSLIPALDSVLRASRPERFNGVVERA